MCIIHRYAVNGSPHPSCGRNPVPQGSYAVQVTIGGCKSEVSQSRLVIITAVEEWAATVDLYPNPAADKLTVTLGEMNDVTISLNSMAGAPIKKIHVDTGGAYEIDMSDLTAGMYLLQVEHKGKVNRYKIIRE